MTRVPDLNFRPASSKRVKAATSSRGLSLGGLSGNLFQVIAFVMILGAGGYHFVTVLATNSLRSSVDTLRYEVASGTATPQQAIVDELQAELDDIYRHKGLVDQLELVRFAPTHEIERVIAALPSTGRSFDGTGMRFQSLALEAADDTITSSFQPLPDDHQPVATVSIQALVPSNTVLEADLRALEQHDTLKANLRSSNRTSVTDATDATVTAQLEILTLTPPPTLEPTTDVTPIAQDDHPVQQDTTVSLQPTVVSEELQ